MSGLAHVELGSVSTIERSSIQPESITAGTQYLGLEHIESGGRILGAQTVVNGELASSKFRFSGKHVLYGKLRPYLAKIALPDFEGVCSTDILPVLPGPRLDRRYLCYVLRQQFMVEMANSRSAGANLPRISPAELAKLPIPLPPLAEQKRIAGILDAADALRAKRREALAQLDSLLQATFLDLFGDRADIVSIGDMLERDILLLHKDGNHGSLYPRAEEFGEVGIPFLSAKCIAENGDLLRDEVQYLSESKARKLKLGWIQAGDVLLAHNASVGKTFGYRGEFDEALIGTSLTAFRANCDVLDPAYLLGALRSHDFQQQLFSNMGQTTRNQVPITAQRRLTLRLPPLDLQKRFALIVAAIEKQRKLGGKHLAELDALFASLQSRAFRGGL